MIRKAAFRKKFPRLLTSFVTAISLSACAVGSDFHSPEAPTTNNYTKEPLPKQISANGSGSTQYLLPGQDIPGDWWTLYHSPKLNQLITTGLANSPTLAAAEANLRQAQATLSAQVGSTLLPAVNATVGGERQRSNAAGLASGGKVQTDSIYNVYNTSVGVSYNLDVFGASRRAIEASRAQMDYQRYQLAAAHITLTTNIVTTAITIASLQSQIQALQSLAQEQQNDLTIVTKQLRLGGASETDVLTQQTQLAQTQAQLPGLQKSLAQSQHALAVLIGELPSEAQLPNISLDQLTLPSSLPISLPSALIRQRPDVLAAEATLHQASAEVGVATANLFPQFSLNATYGWSNNNANELFSPASIVWNWGSQLTQPLFAGGSLMAKRHAAIDAYDAASAQYKQTVLQAFQNVADVLRALETDTIAVQAQQKATSAAHRTFTIAQQQFHLGAISYLSLLTAEQQYQQAKINYLQAQALRYNDTAALFQALGGGWWNGNNTLGKNQNGK